MKHGKAPPRPIVVSPLAASRGDLLTHVAAARTPSPQPSPPRKSGRGGQRGFTLTELLVAIGIMALLSTLTVVSVKSLSNEARLSSGRNAVSAALGAARAFAMKNNQIVLVAFRAVLDDQGRSQHTEMWLMQWTGETYTAATAVVGDSNLVDRFVPVPGSAVTRLPRGIKVAGPMYRLFGDDEDDALWVTQSQLTAINQSLGYSSAGGQDPTPAQAGEILGVMYAADGTTLTHNSLSDSNRNWPDFDNDGNWKRNGIATAPTPPPPDFSAPFLSFYEQTFYDDESNVNIVPFLAVYDDAAARATKGDEDWDTQSTPETIYEAELLDDATGYISQYADRIHFNRYTGVIMK